MSPRLLDSFLSELEKIAASSHRLQLPKSRSGKRPVSVRRLLEREKDGTLYKGAKKITSAVPTKKTDPAAEDTASITGAFVPTIPARQFFDASTR